MRIGIEQRFSAAQQELDTRLTNRQSVVTTYTSVAVPLICAAVAMSTSHPEISSWLGLSLPPVALAFALLYAHNDLRQC
jgi:hypothetical protein